MPRLRILLAAAGLSILAALPASAQQIPGAELGQVLISRQALEDYATRLEQTAQSGNFSSTVRNSSRARAALVRTRLREGDFRVGDRILLTVDAETSLTREFVVLSGRVIALPGVGTLPMAGVLRVELADHIRTYLAQFLRDPKVRAQALIRVVIVDGVGKQGWMTVPVDIGLDSVLTVAGGLAALAVIDRIRIERNGEELYGGQDLQRMISDGQTLDALSLQQGDRIIVPQTQQKNPQQKLQMFTFLLTVPITIAALINLFK